MLSGSFTSTFATQGVKRLMTDRADQLRHSSLPPLEFAETIINMAAAAKQQPTTAYRTFMTTLQLVEPINKQADAQAFWATSAYSSPFPILLAIRFRPEPISQSRDVLAFRAGLFGIVYLKMRLF